MWGGNEIAYSHGKLWDMASQQAHSLSALRPFLHLPCMATAALEIEQRPEGPAHISYAKRH